MKILVIICIISVILIMLWYMRPVKKGNVVYRKFIAESIKGNKAGEDANRGMAVYLPPGYDEGSERYPVIYFLHGYNGSEQYLVSSQLDIFMDAAIAAQRIKPAIIVVANSNTTYGGSFYTNSTFTGRWADYIGTDVVQYVDRNFRTIPEKNSRGLAGHSMGGNGALKIGMLFPDIFGSVYALSPSALDWGEELTLEHPAFLLIDTARNKGVIYSDPYAAILMALAMTYSPNEQKPPYYANLPAELEGGTMVIRDTVKRQWEANFPLRMIDRHLASIKGLKSLKFDWGRDDECPHIPYTCKELSKKLKANGITHEAEEYIGTHSDKVGGKKGRLNTHMIPFFAKNLAF